jgi:macrolide-specific efflux system membrane fusion protein
MKRARRRGLAVNAVLVVVLLVVAYGIYTLLAPRGAQSTSGVRTVAAATASVSETVSAAGSVQSAYSADLAFSSGGTVTEIDVKPGDQVTTGQTLAKLDDTQARMQVTVASDNLAVAQKNYSDTAARGADTTQQVAQVAQARLALQQARDTLAQTVLTAPANATVTGLSGVVGQRVGAGTSTTNTGSGTGSGGAAAGTSGSSSGGGTGTGSAGTGSAGGSSGGGNASGSGSSGGSGTGSSASSGSSGGSSSGAFLVLTDMRNMTVRASAAEIDVSKLQPGQDATVTVNALPNTPVAAKVGQIDLTPTTSNGVVQYGVTLNLVNPPAQLRPGQSASVQVTVARADQALAVPSAAVQTSGGQSTVTVLTGGAQQRRPVQVGVRSESLVQITSGLSEGDQVVLPTVAPSQGSSSTGRSGGAGGGFGGGGLGGGGGRNTTGGGR